MVISSKKKVFSQSACPVPTANLVDWDSFFGTVLFLVNENMVALFYVLALRCRIVPGVPLSNFFGLYVNVILFV